MERVIFHDRDRHQIAAQGTTEAAICAQIEMFERGFPFAKLQRPCTIGDGITVIPPHDIDHLTELYNAAANAGSIQKFIPASGAASRMFQTLLAVHSRYPHIDVMQQSTPDDDLKAFRQFAAGIEQFAFYDDLKAVLAQQGHQLATLMAQGQCQHVLAALLTPAGLNYANLPKALLKFHRYADHCRTPLEEHLVEAATLVRDWQQIARLHLTVSPAHIEAMTQHLQCVRQRYEQHGTHYDITWSTQKPGTDTIAVDPENQPFRDRQGNLLFRPGGHGALLENLNDLQGDVLVIKNIDNVVPDHLKEDTYVSTHLLGGYLIDLQQQSFSALQQLAAQQCDAQSLRQIATLARDKLAIALPDGLEQRPWQDQADVLYTALNRPLRVCGVVPNTGEPGGGPFWVEQPDGTVSLQIIETSQVDTAEGQRAILASSTHFHPAHMACGVRDYRGEPFDLRHFIDPETGFISQKSYEGRALKALELPGLWNGAMAHWNTVFVEVPLRAFNPVKTVLDLLRPEHQPA